MKNLAYLTALLLLSITVKAQNTTVFKFGYLPKHEYSITGKTDLEVEQVTTNDSAIVAKTNPKGKKDSTFMKMRSAWKAVIKTMEASASKNIPFTMAGNSFSSKMSANGSEGPLPIDNVLTGQTINGTIDETGKLNIDTLATSFITTTEAVRFAMLMVASELPQKIKFPDNPLKIGDSFTQVIPATTMSIVNVGFNQELLVTYTYKLTAIKDNLVYLDVTSAFTKDFTTQDKTRTITGKATVNGSGKIVFNTTTGYPQSTISNDVITFYVESGLKRMILKLKKSKEVAYVVAAK